VTKVEAIMMLSNVGRLFGRGGSLSRRAIAVSQEDPACSKAVLADVSWRREDARPWAKSGQSSRMSMLLLMV
jgi:hypothetical protein